METLPFLSFDDIPVRELVTGFFARTIHTPENTLNFISVGAGHEFPMHSHPHRQCAFVLEGEFEMTIGDETKILDSGHFAVIAPGVMHAGKAITTCRLLDVFSPVREDYR